MRNIFLMLILLAGFSAAAAQNDTLPPQYKGGWEAYYTYIAENISFPCTLLQEKMNKNTVSFYVEPSGKVSDIHIACCERSGYEKELMKVIRKTSGKWKPAQHKGKAVRAKVSTPLEFKSYADMDYYARGLKKMEKGDFKGAMKDFCRHIHQNPEAGEAYCALGTSNYELGNTKEAIIAWEKAMKLGNRKMKSKVCEACMKVAGQYIEINKYTAAIAIYTKALNYDPDNQEALLYRGIAYMRIKQIEKACIDWEALKQQGSSKADTYLEKYCS